MFHFVVDARGRKTPTLAGIVVVPATVDREVSAGCAFCFVPVHQSILAIDLALIFHEKCVPFFADCQ